MKIKILIKSGSKKEKIEAALLLDEFIKFINENRDYEVLSIEKNNFENDPNINKNKPFLGEKAFIIADRIAN